ncbi:WD40-repeat-containing domain protein [Blastocladiella britannica]|nr:WD40-repeat-containing domain protein [Blastocladiella britannica]
MDASLRDQLDRAQRESRALKQRADLLEKENVALKKSIYELSVKYNLLAYQTHATAPPFTIESSEDAGAMLADHAARAATAASALSSTGAAASTLPSVLTTGVTASAAGSAVGHSSSFSGAAGATPIATASGGASSSSSGSSANAALTDPASILAAGGTSLAGVPGGASGMPSAAQQVLMENMPTASRDKARDGKYFALKADLKGHAGAVYTVQFSPCGRFLASGSFDKTVRIWDAASAPKEIHVLKRHTVNISEVSWSSRSRDLVSAGYDQTCKLWDTEQGKLLASYECEGFVQCVQFSPADDNVFVHGSTRKVLGVVDRRLDAPALTVRTDAMINSVHVYRDGNYVVSGDAAGQLKLWDLRNGGACIDSVLNEAGKRPISHLAVAGAGLSDEPRYMAVNSYDNVIRVYDRGFAPPRTHTRLMHSLKGHKNKNWPIKSAFYNGNDFTMTTFPRSMSQSKDADPLDVSSLDPAKPTEEPSMLLATGSADPYAYLYAVGTSEGQTEMIQRLEGHSDRVYATAFHPTEAVLATCSADFTIKVWSSTGKGRRVF